MRLIGLAVVLALGLALAPLAAEAQQAAKIAQLGYLGTDRAAIPQLLEAFRQGLRDLGYVEGRNLVIEYRYSEGKFERLPALAAELVAVLRQNSVRRQVIDLSAPVARRSRLNGHSPAPPASTSPDALRRPPSGRPGEPCFAPPTRRLQEDGEPGLPSDSALPGTTRSTFSTMECTLPPARSGNQKPSGAALSTTMVACGDDPSW